MHIAAGAGPLGGARRPGPRNDSAKAVSDSLDNVVNGVLSYRK